MASTHKHLRSSSANKRPTTSIADGQIAINTNSTSPGLFFKDSTGATVIKVGPVHVGTTAPNSVPAGSAGNSTGEIWLDTSLTPNGVKIWNGSSWTNATPGGSTTVQGLLELATNAETQAGTDAVRAVTPASLQSKVSDSVSTTSSSGIASSTAVKNAYDLANAALPAAGGTITGALTISPSGSLQFEGSTDDTFETTLGVVNPTADRSILLPNISGTLITTGDTGTVTSTMIADGTIVNGDVNASAAIAGTKISPDFGSQNVLTTGTSTAASFIPASSTVPTNGVYLPAANSVALSTNSAGRLLITSAGNVGIGTASPSQLLHVSGNTLVGGSPAAQWSNFTVAGDSAIQAASPILNFVNAAGSARFGYINHTGTGGDIYLLNQEAGALRLGTGNAERLRITSAGFVGIGTSSPAATLHVNGSTTVSSQVNVAAQIGANVTSDVLIGSINGNTPFIASQGAYPLQLRTNNATAIAIDSSQRVGVGTTSPTARLFVNGSNAVSNFVVNAGTTAFSVYNDEVAGEVRLGAIDTSATNAKFLSFYTNPSGSSTGTERARIDSSGRLGLGTSSPQNLLHLRSDANSAVTHLYLMNRTSGASVESRIAFTTSANDLSDNRHAYIGAVTTGAGTNGNNFVIATNPDGGSAQTRVFVSSTGNVGVGTTSPTTLLHCQQASAGTAATINYTSSTGGGAEIRVANGYSSTVPIYSFWFNNTSGLGNPAVNEISFITSGTEKLRCDSSGRLLVGTSTALSVGGTSHPLQIEGQSHAISCVRHGGTTAGNASVLTFGRSRGTSNGSVTAVQNGDALGYILFTGANGTDFSNVGAQIHAVVDAEPFTSGDTTDLPSRLVFSTTADGASSPTERLRITSGGKVGLGTSIVVNLLDVEGGVGVGYSEGLRAVRDQFATNNVFLRHQFVSPNDQLEIAPIGNAPTSAIALRTSSGSTLATRMFISPTGNVGFGTTDPTEKLEVRDGNIGLDSAGTSVGDRTTERFYKRTDNGSSNGMAAIGMNGTGTNGFLGEIKFYTGASDVFNASLSERARIDSSGRLLVGTSSNRTGAALQVEGTTFGTSLATIANNSANSNPAYFQLIKSRGTTVGSQTLVSNGDGLGNVQFVGTDGTQQLVAAAIEGIVDGTPGVNDMPGRLVFSTTADGASSPTERMRITQGGLVVIGNTTQTGVDISSSSATGTQFEQNGAALHVRNAQTALFVGRQTDDGNLVGFYQAGVNEGSISVSGTTVSYNGAHLSRWSQLPSGAERTEILRGTVLSNIDEMCEWGDEGNEQLNRMKISDVEGDKNVAGVFQGWDDDDDTYTNDFYCAMTGDFIIRIAAGVTVERGDLLMSAGDGTAKPQDDDIIRSKTIAKVTSTNVSCTYEDGSYCVPCVLMAC